MHTSRIVFADKLPQGEHLCAFALADLGLDTPAYNSGATGIDMLWSGTPLLTMAGASAGSARAYSASRSHR